MFKIKVGFEKNSSGRKITDPIIQIRAYKENTVPNSKTEILLIRLAMISASISWFFVGSVYLGRDTTLVGQPFYKAKLEMQNLSSAKAESYLETKFVSSDLPLKIDKNIEEPAHLTVVTHPTNTSINESSQGEALGLSLKTEKIIDDREHTELDVRLTRVDYSYSSKGFLWGIANYIDEQDNDVLIATQTDLAFTQEWPILTPNSSSSYTIQNFVSKKFIFRKEFGDKLKLNYIELYFSDLTGEKRSSIKINRTIGNQAH